MHVLYYLTETFVYFWVESINKPLYLNGGVIAGFQSTSAQTIIIKIIWLFYAYFISDLSSIIFGKYTGIN